MTDQRELPLAFPEIDVDAPLIPVRMVNEYVYCPRLAYLMWVQAEWSDSADTVEGRVHHKTVDIGNGQLPASPEEGERVHARSVSLSSQKLGITAKPDWVEGVGTYKRFGCSTTFSKARPWRPFMACMAWPMPDTSRRRWKTAPNAGVALWWAHTQFFRGPSLIEAEDTARK